MKKLYFVLFAFFACGLVLAARRLPDVSFTTPKPTEIKVKTNAEEYWLSESGVRHNKMCKYYKKTKGAPCKKTRARLAKFAAAEKLNKMFL
ncbi:MAG: hypothetical protein IKO42_05515 [Opitutales bacterium]|nr:hypothetical protein [Opitutales bacterium]